MQTPIRVRFAPSPTGALHIGGLRTALYNYLFAHQQGGQFIVRIEDTDENRLISNAESFIFESLRWCGMEPSESVLHGGAYGPYKQSLKKAVYKKYALQLVEKGYAYYAFDTKEELEQMRLGYKTETNPHPTYNHLVRQKMKNTLSLSPQAVDELMANNTPYVIRFKMPPDEEVLITDAVRGQVHFNTHQLDDKILLKADGMPTYHLAVVIDDHEMKITHVFRGEEWLPSTPIHALLWQYLGWANQTPQWVHLPLILKPNGKGKLSKRDGQKLNFPVTATALLDEAGNNLQAGFKEFGFLPQALVNFLATLGWNDGSEQEIYTMDELIQRFSLEKIHKAGAVYDIEKAKWFNHQWIQKLSVAELQPYVESVLTHAGIIYTNLLPTIIELVRTRCFLLTDFIKETRFFFVDPPIIDLDGISTKWTEEKRIFFATLSQSLLQYKGEWKEEPLHQFFTAQLATTNLKPNEMLIAFRIMLVGHKAGPSLFKIVELIGPAATERRIQHAIQQIRNNR